MKKDLIYPSPSGENIALSIYGAEAWGERPCLLYIHGFKGFKDWAFVPYAGEYFSQKGYCFVAFNFSHNGIAEHEEEFTQIDRFSRNTFSLEVKETLEMIQMCLDTEFLGDSTSQPMGLIGHSRGGGISLLAGAKRPEVAAICTWAGVSNFDRYDKETKQIWREKGYLEVTNSRTGQVFKLGTGLLDDIERFGRSSLNILEATRKFERPLLVIHGQEDKTVPFFEAEHLNIYAQPEHTHMQLIPGAGHTFQTQHPFTECPPEFERVLETTLTFFDEHLKG